MRRTSAKEHVRDGYLGDLPEPIQNDVMNIHKLILSTVNSLLDDNNYGDLKDSSWAMSCIDDFCVMPKDNDEVGSVRVYKKGKTYRCMIQITGHFRNHQYGWIEELLHDFIKNVYATIRPEIRKKYDITMTNEGDNGSYHEGFDIIFFKKDAQEIWELLNDRKTKTITEDGFEIDPDTGEIAFERGYVINISDNLMDFYENYKNKSFDQYISEASHSKLKYDFRFGWDYDTGHQIKVVYSLDNMDITGVGDFYWKYNSDNKNPDGSYKMNEDEYKDYVKKNITRKGNNDHQSKNQKILAIVDLVTNKRLKEVKLISPISIDGHREKYIRYTAIPDNLMDDVRKISSKNNGVSKLKVGEVDNNPSFKATAFFKNVIDKTTGENLRFSKLAKAEFLKNGRGAKIDNINPDDSEIITYKNPNKKQALQELYMHKEDTEYLIDAFKYAIQNDKYPKGWDRNSTTKIWKEHLRKLKYIQNDINAIEDGRYNPSMMKKYREAVAIEQSRDLINEYKEKYPDRMDYVPPSPGFTYYEISLPEENIELMKENKLFNNNPFIKPSKYITEYTDEKPEYNTEMTESQAKKTLRALSQNIMNDEKKKVTQYTANIYANIITKNLLPRWSNGYKKFSIALDSYQSFPTLEFKIPTVSQDFISRFVNGKENIGGFLHRIPEIKIKMSPRIFHTMTNPDDAFNFFKAAIQYYDSKVEKYCKSLMTEVMKMNHNMKHLVSTTKLSGIVTYPLTLLFVFDDVKMDNKKTFELSNEDIKSINQFIRNIYTRYSAPEKEKKKIVEDVKELVKELRESCEIDENMRSLYYLPEAVESYLFGEFDNIISESQDKFIQEQIDLYDMVNNKDPQLRYIREKFGVKKLKKIPNDLVAYISIETEAIKDSNDKMMIASYCLGKIEIVEWYIELIDTGNKKYVVPHTKPYLETVRTQLLACFKKIMDTPVNNRNQRPIIDIKYPNGYEG